MSTDSRPSQSLSLRKTTRRRGQSGNTIVVGMVTLAVLSMIGAATFLTVSNRFRSNYQTASWHDALTSAETGVQYAFTRLRSPMVNSAALTDPSTVQGSLQYDLAKLSAGSTSTNGTVLTGTYNGSTYTRIQLPTVTIPHTGQGSNLFSAVVTVDPIPAQLINGGTGTNAWYRIQSVGTVPLSGPAIVGIQKYDNFLRKLQFRNNGAGQAVTTPQAQRTIEVIAQPITIGSAALFGQTGINLNNQNVVIDSYDSRSLATSSNGQTINGVYQDGLYDATKATHNANIVTDDQDSSSGTPGVINLSPTGAHVYGNVATNNTAVQGSTSNVSGSISENFYETLPLPPNPANVTSLWTMVSSKNVTSGTTLLTAGSASSPGYYEIGDSNLSLSGNTTVTIQAPAPDANNTQYYIQIWIPGSLSTTGNGQITIPSNVHATFYVDGAVQVAGNGLVNNSMVPGNVIFYGTNVAPTSDASNQSMTFNGNAEFAGVIYAPNADVTVKGGGSSGEMVGSIYANNIFFNGGTTLHYDQALGDVGLVIDYRIGSWYEDNSLTRQ